MSERVKVVVVARKDMKRVSPAQRKAMVTDYEKIAKGNNLILNQLTESYDKFHLVVGERFDNWKSIKDFSPELKSLAKVVTEAMKALNTEIISAKLLLDKRGSEAKGVPFVQHKVEILVD
jgi:hypothetical protein